MKKKLLFLSMLLISSIALTNIATFAEDNTELQNKNNEDSAKIDELNKEVDNKNSEISEYEKKVEDLSNKITEISQKIAEGETQLYKLTKDLQKINENLEQLRAKEETTRKEMKLRIQYMYENSNTNFIVMLFKENSFSEFLHGAEYKSRITNYDRMKLNEYKEIQANITKELNSQKKVVAEQKSINESLEKDKQASQTLMDEHNKLISENKDAVSSLNAEIEELKKGIEERNEQIQKNIEEARAKLEAMKQEQAASQNSSSNTNIGNTSVNIPSTSKVASSGYLWPLPSNYTTITSPFASGRRLVAADYINGGHLGVDIGAPTGTPIYATRSGVVVWATFDSVSGNMVCILQDDGRISRYAHMSRIGTSVNKTVAQGEIIGYVGMTGSATGPHLHFQVETNPNAPFGQTAFDPLILF